MYRFSFVENVGGKATEVTREMFQEIIKREKIKKVCAAIAQATDTDAIGKLKRSLPAFCWHAWFDDGKRSNSAAHASGLIMIDLDHVANPRDMWEHLKPEAQRLGVLVVHITPSTKGLRLVFPVPSTLNLEEAQAYYVKALQLENVDACTKDLARMSFCVPEEYFLHINEEGLFVNGNSGAVNSGAGNTSADGLVLKAEAGNSCAGNSGAGNSCAGNSGAGNTSADGLVLKAEAGNSGAGNSDAVNSDAGNSDAGNSGAGNSEPRGEALIDTKEAEHAASYPEYYELEHSLGSSTRGGREGVTYTSIVSALQELLGGVPAHGSRNNFIFSMAAYLRYVCDDDANWIAQILPTYGENPEKWRRTISSACQRSQYKTMPSIVKRAIENARSKMAVAQDDGNDDLPPEMPEKLPKLIQHLVKNVPEVCRPSVANAVFPALGAHLKDVKFWLIDGTEKEPTFMCVTMAKQSSGKSAVNKPIEYIVADIVERDELNRRREQEWKEASANKGANKEKPKRPTDLCVQVLVSDMTNAAFVQRMQDADGHYLYTNLEELDLLKQLQTNGTKDVGKIICLCFDNGKYGQERVGTQSVTARVDIRWNWNASSTIQKGLQFFKGRMVDGTLSRVNFCTIIPDKSKPFVYGKYDEQYAETLNPYIANLNLANGMIECRQALELACKLSEECAEEGALTDDEIFQDMAHRAVTIAYMKAMVLYIAHDMTWTDEIAEFTEWSLRYDLWCKTHFFAEQVAEERAKEKVKRRRGRQNLLDLLPNSFTLTDALEVRKAQGLDDEGCKQMINCWSHRGYIDFEPSQQIYIKTESYLKNK